MVMRWGRYLRVGGDGGNFVVSGFGGSFLKCVLLCVCGSVLVCLSVLLGRCLSMCRVVIFFLFFLWLES